MIKVLFFIETLEGGGAEKVLLNLVNNMDQSKFEITVQTLWPATNVSHLASGIAYKSCFKKENEFTRKIMRLEASAGVFYSFHVREKYDIEIAYLESISTKIISGSTNKKSLKLAWVHCDVKKNFENPVAFCEKTKNWYKKYDKVICVSQNVKESFESLFGNTVPLDVITNTIDDKDILFKADSFVPDIKRRENPIIICIGRLSYEKGVDRLLEAVKKLKEENIEFDLWIVGDGPERKKLEDFIKDYKLENVLFWGFCSNPYPFFNKADVLVCPSRNEGFSTVVAEALILGKPVVTTLCAGMKELLGNSEYGIITENSVEGIVAGLKEILLTEGSIEKFRVLSKERGFRFHANVSASETENRLIRYLEEKRNS